MSDVRVCETDGEPLVFTFEYPGYEYLCVVCLGQEGVFGARAPATPELQQQLDKHTERYERDRAERMRLRYQPRPAVDDEGVTRPTCNGCGATPPVGTRLDSVGKPSSWYSRTIAGVTEFACSRACVPEREAVLPW